MAEQIIEQHTEAVELPQQVKEALERIPKEKRNDVLLYITRLERFSGILPPPQLLEHYEQILPGLAERIVSLAERQSAHRISMEGKVVGGQVWESRIGQVCGLIIALVGLGLGAYLGMNGHETLGGVIGGTPLAGLVGVFVYGKKQQKTELAEKSGKQRKK